MSVHVERRDRVAVVTLDRPDRRNALDAAHCDLLADSLETLERDGARVIVLCGTGPHFCAGADLKTVEDDSFARALRRCLDVLAGVPVLTIAAVQGAALGAGAQLAIACDLRVAEPAARFGVPAARLGLMVDHWTMQRLAMTAGYSPARAMLLAAEEYDGDRAHRLGLVHRLAVGEPAAACAASWAAELATLAPLTIRGHKLGLNALERRAVDADVVAAFQQAWSSADLQEGMAARAEGRPPQFRGE